MGSFFKYLRLLPAPALVIFFLLFAFSSIEDFSDGPARAEAAPLAVDGALDAPTDQVIIQFVDAVNMGTMSATAQESLTRRMSAEAGAALEFVRPMSGGSYVYRLAEPMPAAEVEALSSSLEALPEIRLAEPDLIIQADGRLEAPDAPAIEPDDPLYGQQWHYRYTPGLEEGINLPAAWEVTTGNSSTVVAVIDTGITDHVEFQGRVLPGYDFISSTAVANDGDGRDPDAHDPGDFDVNGNCAGSSSWHGTHVAGTITAAGNNGIGVAGVNWQAKILPVRVLGRCGGYTSDVLDGARWAAGLSVPGVPANENPADVLNLSLGGQRTCSVTEQAAYDAIVAAGKVVVVAAGNTSQDAQYHSPASCDKVITVAATDEAGDRAGFSNYGRLVEISAPGANLILSTYNSGQTAPEADTYAYMAGTSMAAPHVSGVVSLLLGLHPGMTPEQVLARLQDNARDFLPGSSCTTALCGAGILDAAGVVSSPAQPLDTPALSDIANPAGQETFDVQWTVVSGAEWYKLKENQNDTTWETIYEGPLTELPRVSLPAGSYCYRVRAFHPQGYSEWSAVKCTVVEPESTATPTPTPTRIQGALDLPVVDDIANPGGGATFNVQWTAVGGAEWYKVKENLSPSTAWESVYEGPETILHRANLASGDYCYRVRAFNDLANSDWSADKCVSVSSPTPTETATPTETVTPTATATARETATPEPSGTSAISPTEEATPRPEYSLFIPLVRASTPPNAAVLMSPPTDQIIVKFADIARVQADQAGELDRLSRAAGVQMELLRPMANDAVVLGLPEALPEAQVEAISETLEAAPNVIYAQPDRIVQAVGRMDVAQPFAAHESSDLFAADALATEPDDTYYGAQWNFHYQAGSDEGVNLPPAWDKTTGSKSVVVGVVDSGVLNHEDLAGRLLEGFDFISDPAVANDGNGRDPDPSDPGDWEPEDACYSGSPAYASSWHGTHVAGTIGAATNNGMGVAGINWKAGILPIRVLGRCGGYTSDVLDGAMWAAGLSIPGMTKNENPADVLNLSLGASGDCGRAEQTAFDQIADAGVLVVVAAGNQNTYVSNFSPANCKNVVAVAATDRSGDRAGYSNYGAMIKISAPGGGGGYRVLSTSNGGNTVPMADSYAYYQGTSMAAPHVSGIASLLIGLNPGLTPDQVLQRLQDSARAFPAGSTCNTSACGAGIVDAANALNAGQTPPTPTPASTPEGLAAPTIKSIANSDADGNFSVDWTSVPGADSYVLSQQRDDGVWKKIYEGPDTIVKRKSLPDGSYCYRVRALQAQTYGAWSVVQCTVAGQSAPETAYSMFLPLLSK